MAMKKWPYCAEETSANITVVGWPRHPGKLSVHPLSGRRRLDLTSPLVITAVESAPDFHEFAAKIVSPCFFPALLLLPL
jgi:hypothetical protein